jgi:site-specific DNA-methyltransferase (adenine-specific)
MRQIVTAALPLGKGLIVDPFAGSGSTLAAAQFVGLRSIGIEINKAYVKTAQKAIPRLAALGNGVPSGAKNESRQQTGPSRVQSGGTAKKRGAARN